MASILCYDYIKDAYSTIGLSLNPAHKFICERWIVVGGGKLYEFIENNKILEYSENKWPGTWVKNCAGVRKDEFVYFKGNEPNSIVRIDTLYKKVELVSYT
jgi:hypothetical protein